MSTETHERAKTPRFNIRMPENVRAIIDQAAALEGRSTSDFVLTSAVEKARQTIESHEMNRVATRKSDPTGGANEFWNCIAPPRELNDWEGAMVAYLMEQPFRGRDEVRRQLESVRVTHINAEDPSILLEVAHKSDDRVMGHNEHSPLYRLFVQLYGYDVDGMVMWAMLLSSGGYLAKLDVRRADSSMFAALPQPESFAYTEEEFDRREKERRSKK